MPPRVAVVEERETPIQEQGYQGHTAAPKVPAGGSRPVPPLLPEQAFLASRFAVMSQLELGLRREEPVGPAVSEQVPEKPPAAARMVQQAEGALRCWESEYLGIRRVQAQTATLLRAVPRDLV